MRNNTTKKDLTFIYAKAPKTAFIAETENSVLLSTSNFDVWFQKKYILVSKYLVVSSISIVVEFNYTLHYDNKEKIIDGEMLSKMIKKEFRELNTKYSKDNSMNAKVVCEPEDVLSVDWDDESDSQPNK